MSHSIENMLPPKARYVMAISAGLVWLIGTCIIGIGTYLIHTYITAPFWSTLLYIVCGVVFAALTLYWIASPMIGYKRYRYLLEEDRLEKKEGIFWVTRSILPLNRLHQVTISAGPLLRAFHLSSVTAYSAGGTVTVSYLPEEVAEEIALHLKDRINTIVEEEKDFYGFS